ncbi:disulfide oxidoreductase [Mangrovibacillus cuniculi]|uniref:Probable disulfide formation protein n=1 Tax=Mangrovibacillus cuniculi TaxID=2593652 RepID=A0A7S8C9E7_9BACI|nr:disulfide oxidoreductase [Mangrovibacillus cuniculi]QPC45841.1 disulfide bond formation protein B [Mangrovibacillus cuniculi]
MSGDKRNENYLLFGFGVALIATLGSLYFSEIRMYEPCLLCWYQRILMYPQVILFAIATAKKDASVAMYTVVLSGMGILLSGYHYALQKLTFLQESAPACGQVSCIGAYINWLGFITIPFLALTAFILIFVVSLVIIKKGNQN